MNDYPLVSIIMPNWNGLHYTLTCLESIKRLDYPLSKIEVIIADNGSTDGSQARLPEYLGELELNGLYRGEFIEMGSNVGAPAAYNACINRMSRESQYVIKIDNDTKLFPGSIRGLLEGFQSADRVGVVGAMIVDYNATHIVHGPGYLNPWSQDAFQGNPYQMVECDWVNGACMMIDATLFRVHGLTFPEDYFLYFDDIDFCLRVRDLGYRVIYYPATMIAHAVSASASDRDRNARKLYYLFRGRLMLLRRHGTIRQKVFYLFPRLLIGIHLSAVRAYLHGRADIVRPLYRAYWDFLTNNYGKRI